MQFLNSFVDCTLTVSPSFNLEYEENPTEHDDKLPPMRWSL